MKHIMVDLETFSTKSYGAIIALGAVWFEPNDPGVIKGEFYVTIDPIEAQKAGFRVDAETVCWWLDPNQRDAWDAYLRTVHFTPMDALSGFGMWLNEIDGEEAPSPDEPAEDQRAIWGNGAAFDNVLLRQAYEVMNLPVPWRYYNDRCFRTFRSLPGIEGLSPPVEGVLRHHALEDARQQARWLQNIARERQIRI